MGQIKHAVFILVNNIKKWKGKLEKMKKIKLFCFSYAGGSAQEYKQWESMIANTIEIRPIYIPGHGKRLKEELLTTIDAMVEDVYMQIKDEILEGDYAFFGHSMGAIIAHELSNKIKGLALPGPRCVFVSGREAPHLATVDISLKGLSENELKKRVADYGGTPDEIFKDPLLKDIFLPILIADFTACDTYQKQYDQSNHLALEADFVVLTGEEEKLSQEQVEGWQRYSQTDISVYYFPGGHFFIKDQENIVKIVEIVNNQLMSYAGIAF